MKFHTEHSAAHAASAAISDFATADGQHDYTLLLQPDASLRPGFAAQLDAVLSLFDTLCRTRCAEAVPVMLRFWLSDAANQQAMLDERTAGCPCAVSVVEQPPLSGCKVAMAAWMQTGVSVTPAAAGLWQVDGRGARRLVATRLTAPGADALEQMQRTFDRYAAGLEANGTTFFDGCVRTWLYVSNIDINYAGVVEGRNRVFARHGLTPDTHFVASTGIQGRAADASTCVVMDAWAVAGLPPESVTHLHAPDHMNPTSQYGVSFERGTCVDFADTRQVLISGTASIDNRGRVLHVADIERQTLRMLDNVEALLAEASSSFADVAMATVYLRDIADAATVDRLARARMPHAPLLLTYAPVCRPAWLVEMECIAAVPPPPAIEKN